MKTFGKMVCGFITIVAAVLTASTIACKVMLSKPILKWMITKTIKVSKWAEKEMVKEMEKDE